MGVEVPGFMGGDRTDIVLPAPQRELMEADRCHRKTGGFGAC